VAFAGVTNHAMPLVSITAHTSQPAEALGRLGDAVHDALVTHCGVPAQDRFQVRRRVERDELVFDPSYLGIERRDPVFVEITLRNGRTIAVKQALYRAIAEGAVNAGIRKEDVMIVLRENAEPDWSFGNGIAQYVPGS
jgi:4-oxalocrotonate tautomerase